MTWKHTNWMNLEHGQLVLVKESELFPADLLLVASVYKTGQAYVQTAQLDGERTLKSKGSVRALQGLIGTSYGEETSRFVEINEDFNESIIKFEPPNKNLYNFRGSVEHPTIAELNLTVTNKNLLLRGSSLANTEWVIGMVVYTGKESKLMKNQG